MQTQLKKEQQYMNIFNECLSSFPLIFFFALVFFVLNLSCFVTTFLSLSLSLSHCLLLQSVCNIIYCVRKVFAPLCVFVVHWLINGLSNKHLNWKHVKRKSASKEWAINKRGGFFSFFFLLLPSRFGVLNTHVNLRNAIQSKVWKWDAIRSMKKLHSLWRENSWHRKAFQTNPLLMAMQRPIRG